jgi:hypothetical protein
MSKVDPTQLNKLDRRSTILLQASRNNTESTEKSISGAEDPGMDALRGSFGTVGSIIRARSARRMSQSSRNDAARSRHGFPGGTPDPQSAGGVPGRMQRHQLYDAPMPRRNDSSASGDDIGREQISMRSGPPPPRTPTIKFGDQDVAHYYHGPGEPAGARHQTLAPHGSQRAAAAGSQIQRQPSPLSADLERGPLTAPPGESSFYHPAMSNPFDESPATTTGAGFPLVSYNDDPPKSAHRYHPNTGRGYPRATESDDREESVSLVHEPQSDREPDSESEAEDPQRGGVRLLSSNTRI